MPCAFCHLHWCFTGTGKPHKLIRCKNKSKTGIESVWSISLEKVSTCQCRRTAGEIVHWWVLGGLASSSMHCSTFLSVSVWYICVVEVLMCLSKLGQTGQDAETVLLLQWKMDVLCAANMFLLAKLAFWKPAWIPCIVYYFCISCACTCWDGFG